MTQNPHIPATLLAVIMLMLSVMPPACGQGSHLTLNVYLDDASAQRALVLGSVDDLAGLKLLDSCQTVQEEDGQIYAVCGSLIETNGSVQTLSFSASGYYDDYHASFFVPGASQFLEINVTSGLQLFSTVYNSTLVLDVQGYEITDPSVTFRFTAA